MGTKIFVTLASFLISASWLTASNSGDMNKEEKKNEKITASFNIRSMHVSKDGMINWTSVSERGSLPYAVEQYIFDKWVQVAEVEGVGSSNANSYSCAVVFHNGENKFRIKQRGYDRTSRYSDIMVYNVKRSEVSFEVTDHNQAIQFSRETFYMIYDPYGNVASQGLASSLDISDYQTGHYCLIFDNRLDSFQKRKVFFRNSFLPIVWR